MQGHLRVAESKLQLHLSQASIGYVGEFGSECQSSHEDARASTTAARWADWPPARRR